MRVRSGDPSSGPLSDTELARILHAAAEVAVGDADHDLVSTLHVLNTDVLRPAGRDQLYELELRQVVRALCAVISESEQVWVSGGEVAKVNAWVAQHRGSGRRSNARSVLAELFTAAAVQVETGLSASDETAAQEMTG